MRPRATECEDVVDVVEELHETDEDQERSRHVGGDDLRHVAYI